MGELISRKLNDDLEFVDRCWNCNHGESIPGEKLQASFGEILQVFVVVASYDSRYMFEVNRAVKLLAPSIVHVLYFNLAALLCLFRYLIATK